MAKVITEYSARIKSNLPKHLDEVARAARAANTQLGQIQTKTDQLGRTRIGTTGGGLEEMGKQANVTAGLVGKLGVGLAGLFTGYRGLTSFVRRSDEWTNLGNRLKIVTNNTVDMEKAQKRLLDLAVETRQPVGTLAQVYQRISSAMKETGQSAETTHKLTKALALGVQATGVSAEEATAALRQITQAFNKGKLDGDEFRSVAENMPVVLRAIAKEAKVSYGEMMEWSRQGKLTNDVLVKGLLAALPKLETTFKKVTPTITGSTVALSAAWTGFVGQLDDSLGITGKLTGALRGLASVLKTVSGWLDSYGEKAKKESGRAGAQERRQQRLQRQRERDAREKRQQPAPQRSPVPRDRRGRPIQPQRRPPSPGSPSSGLRGSLDNMGGGLLVASAGGGTLADDFVMEALVAQSQQPSISDQYIGQYKKDYEDLIENYSDRLLNNLLESSKDGLNELELKLLADQTWSKEGWRPDQLEKYRKIVESFSDEEKKIHDGFLGRAKKRLETSEELESVLRDAADKDLADYQNQRPDEFFEGEELLEKARKESREDETWNESLARHNKESFIKRMKEYMEERRAIREAIRDTVFEAERKRKNPLEMFKKFLRQKITKLKESGIFDRDSHPAKMIPGLVSYDEHPHKEIAESQFYVPKKLPLVGPEEQDVYRPKKKPKYIGGKKTGLLPDSIDIAGGNLEGTLAGQNVMEFLLAQNIRPPLEGGGEGISVPDIKDAIKKAVEGVIPPKEEIEKIQPPKKAPERSPFARERLRQQEGEEKRSLFQTPPAGAAIVGLEGLSPFLEKYRTEIAKEIVIRENLTKRLSSGNLALTERQRKERDVEESIRGMYKQYNLLNRQYRLGAIDLKEYNSKMAGLRNVQANLLAAEEKVINRSTGLTVAFWDMAEALDVGISAAEGRIEAEKEEEQRKKEAEIFAGHMNQSLQQAQQGLGGLLEKTIGDTAPLITDTLAGALKGGLEGGLQGLITAGVDLIIKHIGAGIFGGPTKEEKEEAKKIQDIQEIYHRSAEIKRLEENYKSTKGKWGITEEEAHQKRLQLGRDVQALYETGRLEELIQKDAKERAQANLESQGLGEHIDIFRAKKREEIFKALQKERMERETGETEGDYSGYVVDADELNKRLDAQVEQFKKEKSEYKKKTIDDYVKAAEDSFHKYIKYWRDDQDKDVEEEQLDTQQDMLDALRRQLQIAREEAARQRKTAMIHAEAARDPFRQMLFALPQNVNRPLENSQPIVIDLKVTGNTKIDTEADSNKDFVLKTIYENDNEGNEYLGSS